MYISIHACQSERSKNMKQPFWKLYNYGVDWPKRNLIGKGISPDPFYIRHATEKEELEYKQCYRMQAYVFKSIEDLVEDERDSGIAEEKIKLMVDLFQKKHMYLYHLLLKNQGKYQLDLFDNKHEDEKNLIV